MILSIYLAGFFIAFGFSLCSESTTPIKWYDNIMVSFIMALFSWFMVGVLLADISNKVKNL